MIFHGAVARYPGNLTKNPDKCGKNLTMLQQFKLKVFEIAPCIFNK